MENKDFLTTGEVKGIEQLFSVVTPKIKLIKNTKGYNWEITMPSHDVDGLEKLNDLMREKFGELE